MCIVAGFKKINSLIKLKYNIYFREYVYPLHAFRDLRSRE